MREPAGYRKNVFYGQNISECEFERVHALEVFHHFA